MIEASDAIDVLLDEVGLEIISAMSKHDSMKSQHEAYGVILEELDEFWDEVKKNPKKLTTGQATERHLNMRKELIQVAAMAVRAIHDLGLDHPQ